jgi:hypothetical protein
MAKAESEIVKKKAVQREPGYLYFVNKDGDVCRVKMKKQVKKKKEEKVAE